MELSRLFLTIDEKFFLRETKDEKLVERRILDMKEEFNFESIDENINVMQFCPSFRSSPFLGLYFIKL